MTTEAVAQVRSFNRLVPQRIGALDDHYLSRDRPLGEARVLWEIGASGRDVRDLRVSARPRLRLPQPAAALARAATGSSRCGRATADRRVRTAHLTAAGAGSGVSSSAAATSSRRSFLAPLSERQQERLVAAMAEVERLLTAALVEIDVVDPASREAQACLQRVRRRARPPLRDGLRPRAQHLRPSSTSCGRLPASSWSRRSGASRSAAAR